MLLPQIAVELTPFQNILDYTAVARGR